MAEPGNEFPTKPQWRKQLRAARRARTAEQWASEAATLTHTLLNSNVIAEARTLGCYLPMPDEPGSVAMLDALRTAGKRLLLPVVQGEQLDWVAYTGSDALTTGAFGLAEPTGERLGTEALGAAEVVLVPALAVDRNGTRLGKGKGFYDRALRFASSDAVFIVLVRDEELVTRLPAEPHDVTMDWAVTPGRGLIKVG
ncbi:5-formyltetrahydrofolate cyclo-ligase [Tamaricihabitans halophyticus]|uniref:5-formyltetrahydrofolate cyclo-ligase n=1 Tax=Tamaricihabitans halophyticus TaxID=1262583 RepID=A0A4R2R0W7_9PSEU|nr:5-formyltetrahydrofolate cyclo-ligase [Tamaricihabitans halophyticus]TCP53045.1 5-formyltetrahydrofolate cyclo-ligase [Tamaricihabitans halophyticus]